MFNRTYPDGFYTYYFNPCSPIACKPGAQASAAVNFILFEKKSYLKDSNFSNFRFVKKAMIPPIFII